MVNTQALVMKHAMMTNLNKWICSFNQNIVDRYFVTSISEKREKNIS
jgi:hypothetical protein